MTRTTGRCPGRCADSQSGLAEFPQDRYTRPMCRLFLILCLLLNASSPLVQFGQAHAHLGHADGQALVHDGHSHDFDVHRSLGDHADAHTENVVDLSAGQQTGQTANLPTWTQWLPLLCAVGLLVSLVSTRGLLLPRAPRSQPPLPSQHPPWPPPLRGPPLSI